MWLSSLRRLVARNSRSRHAKHARPQRRRIIPRLDYLEDRTLLSGGLPYATPSTTSQLIADINAANSSGGATTITLASGTTFDFASAYSSTNNALPIITANITIKGNNDTLQRDSSSTAAFRLFQVASGASLTLDNLKLTGGLVSGSAAKGGAVYNSGNLSMKSVLVAGNQAIGGSGQNALGGGIYSNGGSLTLVHDIIGIKAFRELNLVTFTTKSAVVGASNKAIGGTGGSAQGAGLYVNGGTVKISSATFGADRAFGGAGGSAQGGALYANGGSVTLVNTHVGGYGRNFYNGTQLTKQTVTGSANSAYGGAGGNAQGGGIYANSTTLTLTNSVVGGNNANGGYGASGVAGTANQFAGGAGGNAQGGGIYANATPVSISGGVIEANAANPGDGGNGAAGTALHPTGGAGGPSGIGQGAGVYVQGASLTISNSALLAGNTVGQARVAGAGGAGYNSNGIYGAGGAGGNGSVDEGGNVFASHATVTVGSGSFINIGEVFGAYGGNGGAGGKGKAGGQGGNASFVAGAGLYVANGSVAISGGAGVNNNTLFPEGGGYGGNGGIGGNGGSGGLGEGGGIYALNSPISLLDGTGLLSAPPLRTITLSSPGININTILLSGRGGNGGSGTAGAGGNGGAGGMVQGGGVFVSGNNLTIALGSSTQNADVSANEVFGGWGGSGGLGHGGPSGVGGTGGLALGGGLAIFGNNTVALTNATVSSDLVEGGNGGSGASSGHGIISNFGNGGNAQGGGLFVSGSSNVVVLNSTFVDNEVVGGGGESGGFAAKSGTAKYGNGGTALGGGIYATSSTVNVLNSTFAINLLAAATGNPDIPGSSGAHVGGGGTAQGGGLYAANGTLVLVNDTIAWNFLVTYTIDSNLTNPAYPGASVLGQGAGLYNGPSNSLSMENTIVALDLIFTDLKFGETNAYGTYNNFASASSAVTTKDDDNLIGGVNGISDANLVPGASEQLFNVPLYTNNLGIEFLSAQIPGNYGGLNDTLPLDWSTSPAVSNGDPSGAATIASYEGVSASSTTDQRGLPRVIDSTIDIGATQTQVLLNGSPSVTTVQAGGTITYTLTVTNNEAAAAPVTLTDVLDPNTTYQSASGTGWTITSTPSASSPGGTLTAVASVAANSTATLTITVSVNSNAPGNTTLVNTASIAPTGNSAAGLRSVVMDTQTQGAVNITNEIRILRTPILRDRDDGPTAYVQGALLVNNSGTTLTGPIALVLVGLPSDVTLTNASGYYNGSPYIIIVPPNGTWKTGWWNFLITILEFSTTNPADIKYTPEILQGI